MTPRAGDLDPAGVGRKLAEGAVVAACVLGLNLTIAGLLFGWFLR